MGTLARIAVGVLAISFMTFVAFFGRLPALRGTPIAWLHRVIWVYIPNALLALDHRLTSGRLTTGLARLGNRILYGRHPTILIFFVLLLAGGEFMYLPGAWPRLGPFHQFVGAISIALPYIFLYLAAFSDAGSVTSDTLARYMSHYPYDFTLFHPGQVCRTCNLLKPARSKHCSVCNRCVHKMDHHCVFINNCVGYGNQHWFLLLLLSTAFLTAYGSALGWSMITHRVRVGYRRPDFSLWKPATPYDWHDYLILLTVGIQDDVGVGSVTLLTMMTSPLVWGLLTYHIYLIWCGTTTNESMKWQDWKMEMDEGCAFKRGLPVERVKDPRAEAMWTRWPVEPVQVMVRTESGNPPSADSPSGQGEWERVWRLADVENLYDIGFWDNLTDVFLLDYSFRRGDGNDSDSESDSSNSSRSGKGKDGLGRADIERGRSRTKNPKGKGKGGGKGKRGGGAGKKPKAPAMASVVNAAT